MQSLLLPPATEATAVKEAGHWAGEQVNETAAIASAVCASYVCERCGASCDARSFTTAICSDCQWRVLRKVASVRQEGARSGVFGTD